MKQLVPADYQLTVGLEVHIQLATESKLFAGDANSFGQQPNTSVSVITLAHPGTMPKLNKKAIEYAIKMGLACDSDIARYCIFDRKNYFYPDLPKGFQTTQDTTPICEGGEVIINLKDESESAVKLNRIHLEEDAGKSIHDLNSDYSLIDLNRAGVPLIELVTEPCIQSAEEAMVFLTEIRSIVRFLEICDGNMEQGSLRCDANISVKKKTDIELGKKVEVKNMNSIRNVGRAIKYEFERQVELLTQGKEIVSETRLFDANKVTTSSMRTKEELNDYRYFPEPDLSPFTVSDEWLAEIEANMPDTPKKLREKIEIEYSLSKYDASVLTSDKLIVTYFEDVCQLTKHYKQISNWIQGPIMSHLNENQSGDFPVKAAVLAEMINAIETGKVNLSSAKKQLFPYLIDNSNTSVGDAINELGCSSSQKDDLSGVILSVMNDFPDKVVDYQKGKKNLLGMFMGEVMKRTSGNADPKKTRLILLESLEKK